MTRVSYWTRVPSLPVSGCLVGSPVVLLDTCSFTASLWLSGGVPSGATGHVFLHCQSLAVWWGPQWCALPAVWPLLCQNWLQMCGFGLLLLVCLFCSTSIIVPTVVVVVSTAVARAGEVHSWPVCPSLLQMKQCLQCWRHSSRWFCLQQPLLVCVVGGFCCCQPQLSP